MIFWTILGVLSLMTQSADKQNVPLVSATDPFYLSCTYWNGKKFTDPESRSARTPILESQNGFRAYGEVKVTVNQGDCENTTTLFVSSSKDAEFKVIYKKDGDGNGIRLVGWSPNGQFLLLETNEWVYETDSGFATEPAIFDATNNTFQRLQGFDKALKAHFSSACEFEHAATRWQTDSQFVVKISRTPLDESYEQHFCVKTPTLLIFDVEKQMVSQLPPTPIKK